MSNDVNARLTGLLTNLHNPKLNKKNAHFGNRYADLESILKEVKPILEEYDFRIVQSKHEDSFRSALVDGETGVATLLVETPFILDKQTPQAVGSALTYYRRYGILLLLNLVGEDDDDAEAAMGRGTTKKKATVKGNGPTADIKENW